MLAMCHNISTAFSGSPRCRLSGIKERIRRSYHISQNLMFGFIPVTYCILGWDGHRKPLCNPLSMLANSLLFLQMAYRIIKRHEFSELTKSVNDNKCEMPR
jgi:hypothetical protein